MTSPGKNYMQLFLESALLHAINSYMHAPTHSNLVDLQKTYRQEL